MTVNLFFGLSERQTYNKYKAYNLDEIRELNPYVLLELQKQHNNPGPLVKAYQYLLRWWYNEEEERKKLNSGQENGLEDIFIQDFREKAKI